MKKQSRIAGRVQLVSFIFTCLVLISAGINAQERAHKVLVLYETESTIPATREIFSGFFSELKVAQPVVTEYYSEFLDLTRFTSAGFREKLSSFLTEKYSDTSIDAIVAVGSKSLDMSLELRERLGRNVPVVVGGVNEARVKDKGLPDDVFAIVRKFDVRETARLAKTLHPDANRIVVITGSAPYDHEWLERAHKMLGPNFEGLEVEYLSELTLAQFKTAASGLGENTILIVLTVLEDADGQKFVPRDAVTEIALVSTAPVYSVYSTFLGTGIVGGKVNLFEDIGADMARLVGRILDGEPPKERLFSSKSIPLLDWHQLKRWNIDRASLPADVRIELYDPTVWEKYRLQILVGLMIIALQSVTIFALIISARRRRVMAHELALERLQLTHLARANQLGQLSGAFAHELNQPLTSILANAEAGLRLMNADPPDLTEVRDILGDIASADRRAADTISNLRKLLVKQEVVLQPIDLNKVVEDTLKLASSELVARQTTVNFRPSSHSMIILGNSAQLQQIVLNLVLNAAEAMSDLPKAQRVIEIETGLGPFEARRLSVADAGRGMSDEMKEKAFSPFVSGGKHGMGLGLPICRSIAQAHGGTLNFDTSKASGTCVYLSLPSPEEAADG